MMETSQFTDSPLSEMKASFYDPLQADLQQRHTSRSRLGEPSSSQSHSQPKQLTSSTSPSNSHKRKHSRIESNVGHSQHESFLNTDSDTPGRFDDAEEDQGSNPRANNGSKRRKSQSKDWPLQGSFLYDKVNSRREHNADVGGQQESDATVPLSPRSSKFLEGSMNDRVSKRPPSPFLKNDSFDEHGVRQSSNRSSKAIDQDAAVKDHRSSGIFRFGKVIASTLNPSTMWGSISNMWSGPAQQDSSSTQPKHAHLTKERKSKAEQAYDQLKKSGFKGTANTIHVDRAQASPTKTSIYDIGATTRPTTKDDSDLEKTPKERKRYGIVFDDVMFPSFPQESRGRSMSRGTSDLGSSAKPSTHIRAPSLQNIKNVANHLQPKRHSAAPAVYGGNHQASSTSTLQVHKSFGILKKEPSRKDLAKEEKLNKKVSNLESKLEKARRELRQIKGESSPPPEVPVHATWGAPPALPSSTTRRHFIPGNLPSLPSERLLQVHAGENDDSDDENDVVRLNDIVDSGSQNEVPGLFNANLDPSMSSLMAKGGEDTAAKEAEPEPQAPTPPAKDTPPSNLSTTGKKGKTLTKKRKNVDEDENSEIGSQASGKDFVDPETNISTTSHGIPHHTRSIPKPSKLHKMSKGDSPGSAKKKVATRVQPKRGLATPMYTSRNVSTVDLSIAARQDENGPSNATGRPKTSHSNAKSTLSGAAFAQLSSNNNHSQSRRVSPYPYSSPQRSGSNKHPGPVRGHRRQPSLSAPFFQDDAITVIPGADTEGGGGEKVPPVPPVPVGYEGSTPKPRKLDAVLDTRSSAKENRAKGGLFGDAKAAQARMQMTGKMSITTNTEENSMEDIKAAAKRSPENWPDYVF